jgi:Fic family protein
MKRITPVRYLWEAPDWPRLRYDAEALLGPLGLVRRRQGELWAMARALGLTDDADGRALVAVEEVLASSGIEGERLDPAGVRSSVARRLDLPTAGLPRPGPREDGAVAVTLDAVTLFPAGYSGLQRIVVGDWRGPAPMRVVSGRGSRETVHFEAPPQDRTAAEMERFFVWWREESANLDGLLRAGLAHLHFLTIHPFEDGNGRLARAIADMALAQDEGTGRRLFSLSPRILAEREAYYEALERAQKGSLDVTDWLSWFLGLTARAMEGAAGVMERVAAKAAFWRRFAGHPVSERQRKAVNRLLDAGEAFEGGLTTRKYAAMTKTSRATAYRDLAELAAWGLIVENPGRGRNVSYRVAL